MTSALQHSDSIGADGLSVLALSLLWDIPDTIVHDSATITWRVERWTSTTAGVRSPFFLCNSVKWRLLCYPHGSAASSSQDSVSLYLDRGNFGQNTDLPSLCVQFAMVMSNPYEPSIFIHQSVAKRVHSGEVLCGFDRFCSFNDIEQRRPGKSASILSLNEVDVTVFLRVMYDPHDTLWLLGIPPRVSTAPVVPAVTTVMTDSSQNGSSQSLSSTDTASMNGIAGPSGAQATVIEAPPKPLPPCRAAYPGEECMICADEPLLFPAKPPTAVCQHEARVCLPCLRNHIAMEITGKGGVDGVVCPAPDCVEALDYHEIKFWADEGTFARYDRILTRRALGVEDDFVFCTNPKCDGGQIHSEGAAAPIVTCYVCHHRTCFTHQMEWHDGYTCDEWDQHQMTRVGMATTAEYMSKFTKMCPKCKKPIEKSQGCDKMECKLPAGCGHTFCWLCLAPYEDILRDGNHRHYTSCKHYAAYDDPKPSRPASTPGLLYDLPAQDFNATPSTSASSRFNIPYTARSTLTSQTVYRPVIAVHPPVTAVASTSTSTSSYQSQTVGSTSTRIGVYTPYSAGAPSSANNTSKSERKWYRFWKE